MILNHHYNVFSYYIFVDTSLTWRGGKWRIDVLDCQTIDKTLWPEILQTQTCGHSSNSDTVQESPLQKKCMPMYKVIVLYGWNPVIGSVEINIHVGTVRNH